MILEILFAGYQGYQMHSLKEASKNNDLAEQRNIEIMTDMAKNRLEIDVQSKKTDEALDRLSNRRNSVFLTSFSFFARITEPLDLVDLDEKDRTLIMSIRKSLGEYLELKNNYSVAKTKVDKSEALTSFLLLGLPGYLKKKSELRLEQASVLRKNVEIQKIQTKQITGFLHYIEEQCNLMAKLTVVLNTLFVQNLKKLEKVIEAKGGDKYSYTLEDRQLMRLCFNLAGALKHIASSPVIENDKLSQAFVAAIEYGDKKLNEVQELIKQQNLL